MRDSFEKKEGLEAVSEREVYVMRATAEEDHLEGITNTAAHSTTKEVCGSR